MADDKSGLRTTAGNVKALWSYFWGGATSRH